MHLRPYQEQAKLAIQQQWADGIQKTLLVLPTGTGKTIVFSKLSEDCVRDGERVLILAHRGELLDQAADKMDKATGLKCAIEKGRRHLALNSWYRGRWLCPVPHARETAQSIQAGPLQYDHC